MYPRDYFALFPAVPHRPRVFVAMNFGETFRKRRQEVIEPAISSLKFEGEPLTPHVVDTRVVGDSILTEILDGIAHDVLFFADVSTIGHLPTGEAVRSVNVLYEVGIAHAVRRPERVLLFRSDRDPMSFDLANMRINDYTPDEDPAGARKRLSAALESALREHDLTKTLAVESALRQLDMHAALMLMDGLNSGQVVPPVAKTVAEQIALEPKLAAFRKLMEMGAIESRLKDLSVGLGDAVGTSEATLDVFASYNLSQFGKALAQRAALGLTGGRSSRELREMRNKLVGPGKQ